MKMFRGWFYIISIILILGCKHKPANKEVDENIYKSKLPNTTISGTIKNLQQDFIVISKDAFYDTITIKRIGEFNVELYLSEAGYFYISDGTNNLKIFIAPKDNFKISYDRNHPFNSIKFNGKGAQPNIYIRDKYLLMIDNSLTPANLYELPVNKFKYVLDSLFVINKMFFQAFIETHDSLPELFIKTEKATLIYNWGSQLIEYLTLSSFAPQVNENTYLGFMDTLTVNNSNLLDVYEYKLFLNSYIDYELRKKIKDKNLEPYETCLIRMQTIVAKIQNQEVKNYLLFTALKEHVKYYGYKNTDLLFKTFEFQCTNEKMRAGLLVPFNEYTKLLQKQKAPDIKMTDSNGKTYSLQHFKGRYIYIDIWATWCLPCRKEAPHFDALKNKYSHKNIEFISISIDNSEEDWLEFLSLKNLSHNHFLATDIQLFLDSYMIKTIPHFLIIDDKGNLLDPNASRPSDNKINWIEDLPDKPNV